MFSFGRQYLNKCSQKSFSVILSLFIWFSPISFFLSSIFSLLLYCTYLGVNAKQLYLLLYSISLKTVLLLHPYNNHLFHSLHFYLSPFFTLTIFFLFLFLLYTLTRNCERVLLLYSVSLKTVSLLPLILIVYFIYFIIIRSKSLL